MSDAIIGLHAINGAFFGLLVGTGIGVVLGGDLAACLGASAVAANATGGAMFLALRQLARSLDRLAA